MAKCSKPLIYDLVLFVLLHSGLCMLDVPSLEDPNERYSDYRLSTAINDFMIALPTREVVLVIDHTVGEDFQTILMKTLNNGTGIMVAVYRIQQSPDGLFKLYSDINRCLKAYTGAVYFIMTAPSLSEEILKMVFYSQADSSGFPQLKIVNWWSTRGSQKQRLYKLPLLPDADNVYEDFNGRSFNIPVLHKPPWHFVTYHNSGIVVEGGRDDKLLQLLANKLNFKIEYFDPPEKSQGSVIDVNGTMNGVLGQIWRRDVDLFMGDLTVTYNRSQAVEFSFLTLADNEAFLTHAPGRLNEALALVRSFHWEVWPLVIFTVLVTGPLLFFIIYIPHLWDTDQSLYTSPLQLFYKCNWFIYAIFLRQGVSVPTNKHKVRFVAILLTMAATYVIGDMYSANLTSMLARPARESPITNLEQLLEAMENKDYQLLVEKFSASHGNVENGTGLYKKIWQRMLRQNMYPLIDSPELGMKLVRDKKNVALIGGRETFFFDTQRFGAHNFHLSEKLYTRYSAIAMQLGCPFIAKFNQILMRLFEAGILTKITEDEYEKLGEKKRMEAQNNQQSKEEASTSVAEGNEKQEEDGKLQPMSLKALQGGFFILLIGYCTAGISGILRWPFTYMAYITVGTHNFKSSMRSKSRK